MKHKKLFSFLAVLVVVSLACSFSFDADLGDDNNASQSQDQETTISEDEPSENLLENNSASDSEEAPGASGNVSKGGGQFADVDEVISNPADENEITSPAGQTYSEVQIKSGPDIFTFSEDINDGCFEIIGIGTATVQVNRIGDGRDCKEMGGIGLKYTE